MTCRFTVDNVFGRGRAYETEGIPVHSKHLIRSMGVGRLFALVIALSLTASTNAFAQKWQGITEAENRIVFSGSDLDDYRAVHYYHPFDERNSRERYRAVWTVGTGRRPVFRIDLMMLPPDHHYPADREIPLVDRFTKAFERFKNVPISTVETGTAGTAVGPAEFVIIQGGKRQCGVFHLYLDDGTISQPETRGNSYLVGFYCPVSAQVDAQTLESLLSRVGVRGIAVPSVEEPPAASPLVSRSPTTDPLTILVTTGDMKGLRRASVKEFDPDTIIPIQHPRFAGGRVIRRPVLVAAALFGRTEMVVFLLKRGATTRGPASSAICAAIAMSHPLIVDVLLKKDPELKDYDRCGRGRSLSPIELAKRLNHRNIVDKLLADPSR